MSSSETGPLVSVLLPVFGEAKHLQECLQSLESQTLARFELLVVLDQSSQETRNCLRKSELALRVLEGPGQGLSAALNIAARAASTEYLVRADSDDISLPARFEKLYHGMDSNPTLVVLGSQALTMNVVGEKTGVMKVPQFDNSIRARLPFASPFIHSSVIMRRGAFLEVGGYAQPSPEAYPEDYELWYRMQHLGSLANLRDELVIYRIDPGGTHGSSVQAVSAASAFISARAASGYLTGNKLDRYQRLHYSNILPNATMSPRDGIHLLGAYFIIARANRRRYGAYGLPVRLAARVFRRMSRHLGRRRF